MMLDNPWRRLPDRPPFVLREDEAVVRAFNDQAPESYRLRIDEILPEPFVGDQEAPVVLLGNNPGFKAERMPYKLEPRFVARMRDNLLHKPSDSPFVFFAPDIHESHQDWWNRKLRELLLRFRHEDLSRSIFAVEYFPYPSQRYRGWRGRLPSQAQDYTSYLVKKAIARKAVIVLTRGERRWLRAVPALEGYEGLCKLRNPQTGSISSRNCQRFREVVLAIERRMT